MASTKKPTSAEAKGLAQYNAEACADLAARLENFLVQTIQPGQSLLLALSGGLDSRVLFDLLVNLRAALGFKLQAMHVHHGLSPNADDWTEFCRQLCHSYQVPFEVVRVKVQRDSGQGLEAAARKERYQALLSTTADHVVLAHHLDDQAETLLLQLLRGAGVKGLSAMAARDADRRLLRPLLDVSRAALEAYALNHQLQWVEDESNFGHGYDRNFLRHQILPELVRRFPAARETLARSAAHMAEAALLLEELASEDAQRHVRDNLLDTVGLAGLSEPRARNLLRWWLSVNKVALPSAIRLQEMLRQLLSAKPDASLKIKLDHACLRRYQGMAYLHFEVVSQPVALTWQGEASLTLPDNSQLLFQREMGLGLALNKAAKLRISARQGGERFKPDRERPTRTLKHLLQEAQMPPWLRERLPLIYCEDTLAVVPGIGVACELQAKHEEMGLVIAWQQG
jgi:tRNA(Ile)-lysidine synthase